MYCSGCGALNDDTATVCRSCGTSLVNPYRSPSASAPGGTAPINNYLVPAIFSTVCCCMPFGIASIVYAAQVNTKLAGGDFEGAQYCARQAKLWFWIAVGVGLFVQLFTWIAQFAFIFLSELSDFELGP